MLIPRSVVGMVSVGTMVLGAGVVCGQDYPNKPVRIVTIGPGGGGDFAARLIAPELSALLGQPVVVENRPGLVVAEYVAKSPPDGYTVLLHGLNFWLEPLLRKTSYDPVRDFTPITMVLTSPNVLVVHPSLPAKSVKELIDLAKARPGELNYAASEQGSLNHVAGELFKTMAGVNTVNLFSKSA